MLPLKECRRILGPECAFSDQDIERLRGQLRDLASVMITAYEEQQRTVLSVSGDEAKFEMIPEEDRDEVEERAAIIEFLGGKPRSEADQLAVQMYFERSGP